VTICLHYRLSPEGERKVYEALVSPSQLSLGEEPEAGRKEYQALVSFTAVIRGGA